MNSSDAEIIKALECCTKGNTFDVCLDCPLLHTNICTEEENGVMKLALDLINRLKADNKNCGVKIQNQREQLKACNEKIKEQQAEIERLKKENHRFADIGKMYSEIRAEAYKEFAERLKEELSANTDNNGDINSCIVPIVIDNLLKEMGCDNA